MININKNIKQAKPGYIYRAPLISVIIRTHNSEDYVEKSLDSVINQTLSDMLYEIIVIDDGSTDRTINILEKYSDKIILIRENFLNPIKTLNRGISAVRCEYFIILDSDDVFELNALKEFFNLIKNDYFDFAYSDYFEVDVKTGSRKIVSLSDNIFSSIAGGIIFRRSVVNKFGGYAEDLFFPEYDLLINLIKNGCKSRYIPKPLYTYFRHGGSLTSNKKFVKEGFEQLYQKYGKIKDLRRY